MIPKWVSAVQTGFSYLYEFPKKWVGAKIRNKLDNQYLPAYISWGTGDTT